MKRSLVLFPSRELSPRPAMRTARAVLAIALAAACTSCSTPATSERFYALSAGAASSNAPAEPAAALPGIVISAVTVPELVDRPQIVTRDGANRVNVAEQQLWAEPLKNGIGRVLAVRLTKALADAGHPARVAAYPQASIANPDLRITLDVQRFDATPGGDAIIDVLWSVRRSGDDSVRSGRTFAARPIAALTYEDTVSAWSDALEALDKDIAAAVVQIDATQPATSSKTR